MQGRAGEDKIDGCRGCVQAQLTLNSVLFIVKCTLHSVLCMVKRNLHSEMYFAQQNVLCTVKTYNWQLDPGVECVPE